MIVPRYRIGSREPVAFIRIPTTTIMSKNIVYLAGPMRGLPQFNFPAFFAASLELRKLGFDVRNPAERDMAVGFNPSLPLDAEENLAVFDLAKAFEWDFQAIMDSVAIVLLPNWRDSKGVQAELVLAMALHRDVYEWVDGAMVKANLTGYDVRFDSATLAEKASV